MQTQGSPHLLGVVVVLFLFTIYLCGYSGIYHAADELSIANMAESLLADGSLHVNQMEWEQTWLPSQNTWGVDGNLYSKKGFGLSLLILPFLAIGKLLSNVGAISAALLVAPLLTAMTGWILFSTTQQLRLSPSSGLVTALAWGLGTLAIDYANILRIEPLAACGVALAIHGCILFRQQMSPRRPGCLVEVSLGSALMILAKPALGVVVVVFGLFVLWQLIGEFRLRHNWQQTLRCAVAAALPVLIVVLLTVLANYRHFHTYFFYPMTDPNEGFLTPLPLGLRGLLLSPGKGLLWYVPLTWLIPLALPWWRKTQRLSLGLLLLTILLATILLFAGWSDWAGGRNWGPRMIVPALPALALLIAPLWEILLDRRARTWQRLLLGGLLLVSIGVQLPGALVNISQQEALEVAKGVTSEQLLWSWQHSPLWLYWRAVRSPTLNPLLLQPILHTSSDKVKTNERWAALIALLLLLLALLLAVAQSLKQRVVRWQLWIGAGCAGLAALLLVKVAEIDPRWQDGMTDEQSDQQIVRFLGEIGARNNAVLLDLDPVANINGRAWWWLNDNGLYPRTIGWRRRAQMTEDDRAILVNWLQPYQQVWLAQADMPDDAPATTTEQLLNQMGERGAEQRFGRSRVVAYRLRKEKLPAPIAANHNLTVQFGNQVTLNSYEVFLRPETNSYVVNLYWQTRAPSAIHFSVQALSAGGTLLDQADGPIGYLPSGDGFVNRVTLAANEGCQLILKVYNYRTSEVLPLSAPGIQAGQKVLPICQSKD